MIEMAFNLMMKAHEGQKDRAGKPYFLHPLFVASQMRTNNEIIVALLHDVIEDSDITIEDLGWMGFDAEVVEAVSLMTHLEEEPYDEYVRMLNDNPISRAVKLADLRHNMDLTRLPEIKAEDLARQRKYQLALQILQP